MSNNFNLPNNSSFVPDVSGVSDIGAPDKYIRNVYANNIYANTITSSASTSFAYIYSSGAATNQFNQPTPGVISGINFRSSAIGDFSVIAANPHRITWNGPSAYVEFTAHQGYTNNGVTLNYLVLTKNGDYSNVNGIVNNRMNQAQGNIFTELSLSAIVPVVSGDYFQLTNWQSAGNVTISTSSFQFIAKKL